MTTYITGRLLSLDARDRAGLEWLRNRARFWLTALKRRRKRLPPGEPFGEEEAAVLRVLLALESVSGQLLELTIPRQGVRPAGPWRANSCPPAIEPSSADRPPPYPALSRPFTKGSIP